LYYGYFERHFLNCHAIIIAIVIIPFSLAQVDVDECEDLAGRFEIASMPTVLLIRGGNTPKSIVGRVQGGGPQFLAEFGRVLGTTLTDSEAVRLTKYNQSQADRAEDDSDTPSVLANMSTSQQQLEVLSTAPLADMNPFVVACAPAPLKSLSSGTGSSLPFDVSRHESAGTAVARSVLDRIEADVKAYAGYVSSTPVTRMIHLTDADVAAFFAGDLKAEDDVQRALSEMRELQVKLRRLKDDDERMVQDCVTLLEKASNWVDISEDALTTEQKAARLRFLLQRTARQNAPVWIEFLFGTLLSSSGDADLLALNPYLDEKTRTGITKLVTTCMLRANRVGHANRCIGAVISLENLLTKVRPLIVSKLNDFLRIYDIVWQYDSSISTDVLLITYMFIRHACNLANQLILINQFINQSMVAGVGYVCEGSREVEQRHDAQDRAGSRRPRQEPDYGAPLHQEGDRDRRGRRRTQQPQSLRSAISR
jgi:hypothetical protein